MAGKDWNNLGSDLNRIIEDAVHMGNFGRLNESINDTIRKAFNVLDGQEFRSGDGWDFNLSKDDRTGKSSGDVNNGRDNAGQRQSASGNGSYTYKYVPAQTSYGQPAANGLFAGSGKRKGGAIAILIIGIIITAVSFAPFCIFLLGTLWAADMVGASISAVFLVLMALGIVFIVKGGSSLSLSKRFEKYVRVLDGQEYIDIKMLAQYCHMPQQDVLKGVKKMLRKGWFLEGHLDNREECLMVSDDAYEQYLTAVKNAKLREEEKAKRQQEEMEKNGGLTPEVRAILKKGNEYIESIHRSNDAIPGEEISNKIYRMEMLVKRILQQTEAHSENAPDLRKLMEYYLPMTVKLLKAYEELDSQPVNGENIASSKKEIEDTLDTLNVAFEKLLDSMFKDTAWDVSSDISVLQTMLAQEGLTDDGLMKSK